MLRRGASALLQQALRPCAAAEATALLQQQRRGINYYDAPNGPAVKLTNIEDEWYNRQRTVLPLLDKEPFLQEPTWVAPSAVVVGDVDIYEKARGWGGALAGGQPAAAGATCATRAGTSDAIAGPRRQGLAMRAHGVKPARLWLQGAAWPWLWPPVANPGGAMGVPREREPPPPSHVCVCVQVAIFFGAVVRGDLNKIRIGPHSVVLDRAVIHAARWGSQGACGAGVPPAYPLYGYGGGAAACSAGLAVG